MATWLLPHPMLIRVGGYAVFPMLVFMLFASSVPARADQLSALAWNCWGGGQHPLRIDCVHERSQPLPKGAPEDTDIELETQLLDQLRENSRSRKSAVSVGLEWKNIEILHKGAQWTIRISAYPAGTSLDENHIAKVASAVLCPADMPCTVKIRKPVPQEVSKQKK